MQLFISYSQIDAKHLVKDIHDVLSKRGLDVFFSSDDDQPREIWSRIIEDTISECDIFVVILTPAALNSKFVEIQVRQAQRENKRIIPCFYKFAEYNNLKWNLNKDQGIEFVSRYDISPKIYIKIFGNSEKWQRINRAYPPPHDNVISIPNAEKIERYPLARFPKKVLLNDIIPLIVIIKAIEPDSRLSDYYTSIGLTRKPEDKQISINVIVESGNGLELQNDYFDTINVPVERKDSKPVLFNIKTKEEGLQTMEIFFSNNQSVLEILE